MNATGTRGPMDAGRARDSLNGLALGDAFGETWVPHLRRGGRAVPAYPGRSGGAAGVDRRYRDGFVAIPGPDHSGRGPARLPGACLRGRLLSRPVPWLRRVHARRPALHRRGRGLAGGDRPPVRRHGLVGKRRRAPRGCGRSRAGHFELEPAWVVGEVGCGLQISAQDTVPYAIWCAARHLDNLEEALWATASAGGDVDTTCAIAGGIVAARARAARAGCRVPRRGAVHGRLRVRAAPRRGAAARPGRLRRQPARARGRAGHRG